MKFRTTRKLKNMILSINFTILTFVSFLSNFLKHFRVGRYDNLFILFWKAIKIAGSAQKNRVGRVRGNTGISFCLMKDIFPSLTISLRSYDLLKTAKV